MKKYLLTMLLALIGCVVAMAGDNVKVIKGDISALKKVDTATVEFNWDKTTWDGKESFKDHEKDTYDEKVTICQEEFIKTFNKSSKGMKIESQGSLKIVITIDNIDGAFKFGMGSSGNEINIWGSIALLDADGTEVCSMKFDKFSGSKSGSWDKAFKNTFSKLAKQLLKAK